MAHRDEILLTPGPLTTAPATREAMLRDWGSRDTAFIAMTQRVRARLVELAGAPDTHVAVPVQGSGTFAVEATLGTLVPRDGKVLILVNGDYCRRMAKMCARMGRAFATLESPEDEPPSADAVRHALSHDPAITHVAMVHCETTSGILNPVAEIAAEAATAGCGLIVDSMSGFGALPVDARQVPFTALVGSANKCLEGVPGLAFAIVERAALEAAEGNASSLSLDLHDQWRGFEKNGQWRFTPPTHVLAAFDKALELHAAEGGQPGRLARYEANCRTLVEGLRLIGFATYLPDALQAPIIVTVRDPADPAYDFAELYRRLRERGIVIYPGKLTQEPTFRIGCIGDLRPEDMRRAVEAIAEVVAEMGIRDCRPPPPTKAPLRRAASGSP